MPNEVHTRTVCRPWKNVDVLVCKKSLRKSCSIKSDAVMHQHPKMLMKEWTDQHKLLVYGWNRIQNDIIRRYVRSTDLEYRQLFTEGMGTINFKVCIHTLDLVLPFGSYGMLFVNFENNPYSLQRNKYAGHPEISKLITLALD